MQGMAMAIDEALSDTDRRLLAFLAQDSRRPLSELAALLGVSRQTVHNRITRLVARGVISRFTIKTHDEARASAEPPQVMFTLNLRQNTCSLLFQEIKAWPELVQCWSVTGDRDMVVIAQAVNAEDAERLRARLSRHPDVLEIRTAHVLRWWKR